MPSWRRRFTRFLGWCIATFASLIAVVLLVVAGYLVFFDYTETLRVRLEKELTDVAGGPVVIRSIDIDITSYSFELAGVTVQGPGAEPILTLERVVGRLGLSEVARLRLHWTELVVQGMRLRLVQGDREGLQFPLATGATPSMAEAGLALSADRVVLEDAAFVLSNESVPWQLEAANLGIELRRELGGGYRGTLSYEDGALVLRDHAPIAGSVSAEIELAAGELFVHEARGQSDIGTVRGRGKLGLGGGVHGRFEIEAEGNLERAASSLLGWELDDDDLTGTATFDGLVEASAELRQLEGTIRLDDGRVHGIPVRAWTGDVFWDRSLLRITGAEGIVGAGRARASLTQAFPAAENPATLELDVAEASLREILSGLSGSTGGAVALESTVSGRASLLFPPTSRSHVDGTFELSGVRPPDDAANAGEWESVAFTASGSFHAGDLELDAAELRSATMAGTLSGLYPRDASAELLVDFRSIDLARTDAIALDVRRLFRGGDDLDPEPWGIEGRGRARGRLTGRLPHPTFVGSLEAPDLGFDRLIMEDVEARAVLSRGALSFEDLLGHRGDGVVAGSGTLSFEGPIGARDFDFDLRFSGWPAGDLTTLLDWSVSVEGLATGDLAVKRVSGELDGVADLDITEPVFQGVSFDRAEADVRFAGKTLQLEQAAVFRDDAVVAGALELDIETGAVQGELSTREFPLDGNEILGLSLSGSLDAQAALAGHLDAPVVDFTAEGLALNLEGADLGDATISGTIVNDDLELELRIADVLGLDVAGELRGDYPFTGTLRFVELDAGPWFARWSERFAETTRVLTTGGAQITAALRRSHSLSIDAALTRVVVQSDRVQLESLAPVEARYQDGILRMPLLTLAADDSRVALGGSVNFVSRNVDFRFEGVSDLGILGTFHPSVAATGSVDLSARVSGNWERPSLSGRADLDGSSVRLEGFAQALGGLRGRIVFDNRTIRIPELQGVFGSGPVSFSGAISLEGLSPSSLDLTATGTGMRLRYPEGLVATLDADLALLGSGEQQVLSGEITLTDALWTREYDLVAGILSDSEGRGLFEDLADNELFRDLKLDVAVNAFESLRLRNSLAEIDGSAELELRGSLAQPVLLGTTEAERGEVFFLGQRYDIVAGKVDFVDPTKVEPFIELIAETRVRSYRVELRLTGTSDRFYPELSSDPPLRTVDILRLLSGANERDILIGTEEEEIAGVGVASLLTERLSQELGRRAERLFGLDRFSIDPFLVGQIANPTARVSLGKQITRDLSINYSSNLNATTEAIILIEYSPEGNTSWILSRDEEGDVGIDVKFRKSF